MRRIVSLLIAAILAIGMTAAAYAADPVNPKITEQTAELTGGYVGDASPGQKIFLPFKQAAFKDAVADLKAADVKTSNITVKHTVKSGPKAIDSVAIKTDSNGIAGVLVTLVDPFTSTKPLDFEVSINLYIGGKRQSISTTVEGTLSNDQQYVDADTDYVDLSNGSVAICEENAAKVEVFLGEDVTMFVRMVKGKSYAGAATTNPSDSDIDLLVEYPDIVDAYTLTVDGLTGTGKIVRIEPEQKLYVYDGDFNYLGTTEDLLPFSTKYYTAEKKLDVIEQSDDEWEEEPEYPGEDEFDPESEPEAESEGDPADIVNNGAKPAVAAPRGDNPNTGVPPMLGVSAVAGLVALVAMAAVSPKKKSK